MARDAATLLRQTIAALGNFDAEQLQQLAADAASLVEQSAKPAVTHDQQRELRELRQSLHELLQSTATRLRILSGLRGMGLGIAANDAQQGVRWVR
jgi:predicted phosphodiesterase